MTDPSQSAVAGRDLAARGWEWAQVTLLLVNLGWTTLQLGGFRPETMVVTSVLTGTLVAVHLLSRLALGAWRDDDGAAAGASGERRERLHPAGWLLLPFLAYAAANVLWVSPVPWVGWRDWFGWAQMTAVFWVVLNGVPSRAGRVALLGGLVVLAFVAVTLGCYQRFIRHDWLMMERTQVEQFLGRASGPFGIPNSLAALLLLLLPATLALVMRRGASAVQRVLFGYLALVFLFGLGLTVSRGAWLALALVLPGWPLVGGGGSLRRRLAWTAVLAVMLGVILSAAFFQVDLVRDRLMAMKHDRGEYSRPILWRAGWRIFCEHPAWGSGAGSYAVAFEKHRPAKYQDDPIWAHNDYLNTLSDYGAVGFALCFGAWAVIGASTLAGRSARGRHDGTAGSARPGSGLLAQRAAVPALEEPLVRQGLAAGLVAFALQLFVDFHFKIPALAMSFAMVMALYVRSAAPGPRRVPRPLGAVTAWTLVAALVAVVLGTVMTVLPRYRAEALRYGARQAIDRLAINAVPVEHWRPVLEQARADLRAAVLIDPRNGAAWADASYGAALWGWVEPARIDELAREAERAADRALLLSKADPEFWIRRGVALDMQRRHVEAGAAFTVALTRAPARARVWYHHAFHLSLMPLQRESALAALAFCLRLDAGNREAHALRERLTGRRGAP